MATKTKKRKSKGTPGVYWREDGVPRWEVKIRWTDQDGVKRWLKTKRFPVDLNAPPRTELHKDQARFDAEAYASAQRRGLHLNDTPHALTAEAWTLKSLLERFAKEIEDGTIAHRSVRTDKANCNTLLGKAKAGPNKLANFTVVNKLASDLTYADFWGDRSTALSKEWKGADGEAAPNGSIKRLLTTVRSVFNRAKTHWHIQLNNPLETLKGIEVDDARERILTNTEWDLITADLANSRTEQATINAIVFIRHTAVRRGECVKLDWTDIDLEKRTAHLRNTKSRKNKENQRIIPLPPAAMSIIVERQNGKSMKELKGPVFSNGKRRLRADTITQAWIRARTRVAEATGDESILTARLHDLRHTRITELGRILSAAEAARVSGHSDLSSFMRYFNPDPVDIGRKIDALEASKSNSPAMQELVDKLAALSIEDLSAAFLAAMARKAAAAGQ